MIAIWPQRKSPKQNTDGNRIHTGKPLVRQNMEITFTRKTVCAKYANQPLFLEEKFASKSEIKKYILKRKCFWRCSVAKSEKNKSKYRHICIFILSV